MDYLSKIISNCNCIVIHVVCNDFVSRYEFDSDLTVETLSDTSAEEMVEFRSTSAYFCCKKSDIDNADYCDEEEQSLLFSSHGAFVSIIGF